ncbi:uncharacterized protein LOC123452207 [Hordeum vulgare subsp. vulgare]|uniref:Oberon PHD finger domain-containing protein n=1 Tax=Hordeum vulgare subsp. vulgare TaxID=112509 RepID=A0A8I6XTF2_HORVV|nr:uncharacterized protein LOC123452207 [Hordeum vulgare subsp. vulgare]
MASSNIKVCDGLVIGKNRPKELYLSEMCKIEDDPIAIPIEANAYGKGLPYAPINWPCLGDEWKWKVGKRYYTGHWHDRYLIPPSRFRDANGRRILFRSKKHVEEFIKREFPDTDPNTFFSMFIWKIPCEGSVIQRGTRQLRGPKLENLLANPTKEKLRFIKSSLAHDYDMFCTMPNFRAECCCIICGMVVDYSCGGYNYMKCEATIGENTKCGHVGHLHCALKSSMAGTVGGGIFLDMEYYCRWCDNKTNLMMHVEKLLETCRPLQSKEKIKTILDMGLSILRGSRKEQAKILENYMGSVMAKINDGVDLNEVWKKEDCDGVATLDAEEIFPPTTTTVMLRASHYPYLNSL